MARRGRKPKKNYNIFGNQIFKSLLSLFLIGIAGLMGIVLVVGAGTESGAAGSRLRDFMTDNFGLCSVFLPLIFLYLGLLTFGSLRSKYINFRVLGGFLLLFLCLMGLMGESAGNIGAFLRGTLAGLISNPGAILVYLIGAIFSLVIISNTGLHKVVDKASTLKLKKEKKKEPEEDEKVELLTEGADELKEGDEKDFEEASTADGEFEEEASVVVELDESDSEELEFISPPSGPVETEEYREELLLDKSKGEEAFSINESEVNKNSKLPFNNRVWEYPPLDLLSDAPNKAPNAGNIAERSKVIEETLKSFGVKAKIADTKIGPSVTQYAVNLSMGTKTSKIQNLATDLALRIKSPSGSVRIEAPIPGTNLVGIEVPNFSTSMVTMKSVMTSEAMKRSRSKLTVPIGHDVSGNVIVQDINRWPHCLIAGATGSGKSVMLNAIICSLLFRNSPQECKFIMIDPKMVELSPFDGIPHLLAPVVTDVEKHAVSAFAWAVAEMERRYKVFSAAGVRNLDSYNELSGFQAEPYIIVVVDELADMMMVAASEIEKYIIRLAQKSRATGIHLILATQRPSVNIITGTIKANITTRMAFKVTSQVDSRVIIDQAGAETLIGRGDMLFVPPDDSKPKRAQGVFVSDTETKTLVEFLVNTGVEPDYKPEIFEQRVASNKAEGTLGSDIDDKMVEALEIVINEGRASASYLQRKLGVGYSRAARMIDEMEAAGIIGQGRGSKPREVLVLNVDEALSKFGASPED